MSEIERLIACFIEAMLNQEVWLTYHPMRSKSQYVRTVIDDGRPIKDLLYITKYYDGAYSLDEYDSVTHLGFVKNINEIEVLLHAFIEAHGIDLSELKEVV